MAASMRHVACKVNLNNECHSSANGSFEVLMVDNGKNEKVGSSFVVDHTVLCVATTRQLCATAIFPLSSWSQPEGAR